MKTTMKFTMLLLVIVLIAGCSSEKNQQNPSGSNEESEKPSTHEDNNNQENPSDDDSTVDEDESVNENETTDKDDIDNDKDDSQSEDNSNNDHKVLTESEVLNEIQKQINTDLDIKLPQGLLLQEGEHLTAITKGSKDSYSVIFFKSNSPIPLNNKSLIDGSSDATEITKLSAKQYSSKEQAQEQVGFEDFSKTGGNKVDLGHSIMGYQDAGAGSSFTSWNEGRWALTARSLTSTSEKGVELAKEAVDFLEKNTLPIPKQYAKVHLDTEENGNLALLQDEEVVYTFEDIKKPIDMLGTLVNFQ